MRRKENREFKGLRRIKEFRGFREVLSQTL